MLVLHSKIVVVGPLKVGDIVNVPHYGEAQIRKVNWNKITIVTVNVDNNLNNTYEFELVEEFVTTMRRINR